MKFLAFLLSLTIVSVIVGAFAWYELGLQPVDRKDTNARSFTLQPGTSVDDLGTSLADRQLVRSGTAFDIYVTIHGLRGKLQAGTYDIAPSEKVAKIAAKIASGQVAVNRVTLPEGITVKKIKSLLEAKGLAAEDVDAALKATYTNNFLQNKPASVDLEGYLFPDTYQINEPLNAQKVIQKMLDNFGQKVNQAKVAQAFTDEGFSLHQGLTLASIVQKEAGKPADQPMIASVFINRLHAGMPLGSDVTVIYAADLLGMPFSTTLNSPYNTYTNPGLPPGPICNPGIDAIKAAAHPAKSDYLYFLADKQGHVYYEHTADEHSADIKKYLQ
jgi:UPF0755 protein